MPTLRFQAKLTWLTGEGTYHNPTINFKQNRSINHGYVDSFSYPPLLVPNYPCHTQLVERGVKLVSEASRAVHETKRRLYQTKNSIHQAMNNIQITNKNIFFKERLHAVPTYTVTDSTIPKVDLTCFMHSLLFPCKFKFELTTLCVGHLYTVTTLLGQ